MEKVEWKAEGINNCEQPKENYGENRKVKFVNFLNFEHGV